MGRREQAALTVTSHMKRLVLAPVLRAPAVTATGLALGSLARSGLSKATLPPAPPPDPTGPPPTHTYTPIGKIRGGALAGLVKQV